MVNKMARLTTQQQIDEVAFFDGKINIAIGIIATLLLGYGQTAEEILLHSVGETIAVHDSGVAVWKNKLQNSRIRPTTVIQALYPERRFTINNNISLRGKHFQALVRTMPHSEFPSGSSCVCQAIDEYTTDLWPHFNLTSQGMPVSFDPASTPVILPSALLPRIPATNAFNPSPDGYTAQTLNKRCGETREEGGMHTSLRPYPLAASCAPGWALQPPLFSRPSFPASSKGPRPSGAAFWLYPCLRSDLLRRGG